MESPLPDVGVVNDEAAFEPADTFVAGSRFDGRLLVLLLVVGLKLVSVLRVRLHAWHVSTVFPLVAAVSAYLPAAILQVQLPASPEQLLLGGASSHWAAETLTAAENAPGRNGSPWQMSWQTSSGKPPG